MDVLLLSVVIVVLVISLIIVKTQHENEIKRRKNFLYNFVSQKVIDEILREEAKNLHKKFLFEQRFQKQYGLSTNDADSYEKKLELSKREIAEQKKRFWQKVDLAKKEDYETPQSYKDLLPEPDVVTS